MISAFMSSLNFMLSCNEHKKNYNLGTKPQALDLESDALTNRLVRCPTINFYFYVKNILINADI